MTITAAASRRPVLGIASAEHVFIHHHLSAGFVKLGSERKRALFDRNKAIYEANWGELKPHVYRVPSG